ncbi:hypothetical protein M514_25819 [Trichuris suis]|uniref:CCHC-type domain-containing protein n=1 Tax=Trichuris suis TaxID=68888 RepID=A0A085MXR3_9BILA|nr:hypothetical protein M514_25819 [Trichuris suis]
MAAGKDPYLIADMEVSLNSYVTRANEIQEELERLLTDDDLLADEVNSWMIFEKEVRELRAQVRKYLEDAGRKPELTKDGEVISSSGQLSGPLLPKWNLPTFDGNVLEFTAFWDQYEAGVHSRTDLNNVTKLVYLRSALTGNALKAVEGFSVTNANYSAVVDALKQRFGRRRAIIECHVKSLLELGRADTCVGAAELREFYDALNLHVRALVALDHDPCVGKLTATDILVTMFKDRLAEAKRKPWEERNSPSEDKTVSLDSFLDFLLSQVEIEEAVSKSDKAKPVRPVKERLPTTKHFSAAALVTKTNDPEPLCAVCQNGHATVNCQNLIYAPVDERWKMVRKIGLCFACLEKGHPSKSCPSRKPCGKQGCGLFHHPLLHVQKNLKEVKVGLVRNRQKAFTLLQTAKAKLCGSNGCTAIVTCLFDASAQRSFISVFLKGAIPPPPSGRFELPRGR